MPTIFTRIIRGEIPCYKIAEDEQFFAFLDINPVAPGHTLVIPKMEIDYLFDQPEEILAGLLPFAKTIATAIDRSMGCLRTGLVVEGLEVPHSHLHLIPIYHEGQHAALGGGVRLDPEKMNQIANAIRGALV